MKTMNEYMRDQNVHQEDVIYEMINPVLYRTQGIKSIPETKIIKYRTGDPKKLAMRNLQWFPERVPNNYIVYKDRHGVDHYLQPFKFRNKSISIVIYYIEMDFRYHTSSYVVKTGDKLREIDVRDFVPYMFVVKPYRNNRLDADLELEVIKARQMMRVDCKEVLVDSFVGPRNGIFMQAFSGDIYGYLKMIFNRTKSGSNVQLELEELRFQLLSVILKSLRCIDNAGYVYLDLKPEQLLYRATPNGDLEIILSDLAAYKKGQPASTLVTLNDPYFSEDDEDTYPNQIAWTIMMTMMSTYGMLDKGVYDRSASFKDKLKYADNTFNDTEELLREANLDSPYYMISRAIYLFIIRDRVNVTLDTIDKIVHRFIG